MEKQKNILLTSKFWNNITNMLTGALGFASWMYLTNKTPEYSVQLGFGVLLMLIGFGGRETIIDIVKSIKGRID